MRLTSPKSNIIMHSYTIPSETGFRNLTVSAKVADLNPDGFTADHATAMEVIEELAEKNGLVIADNWDTYGQDGAERLLVWESEEDADSGAKAMCQIIREKA